MSQSNFFLKQIISSGIDYGTDGSRVNTVDYDFPAVPYSRTDFNRPKGSCPSGDGNVNDYNDANNVSFTIFSCCSGKPTEYSLNDVLYNAN